MKRQFFFLIAILFTFTTSLSATSLPAAAQLQDSTVVARFKAERDQLLVSMAPGVQKMQEDAIRAAIAGDFSQLRNVRALRDKPYAVLESVKIAETTAKKMRLYLPINADENSSLPLLIYAHGGGWTFGSLNSCMEFCMQMAQQGVAVLAIDYPLSPEQHFPAAVNAFSTAYGYALTMAQSWGVNPAQIFVGGDSAGGNLALAMVLSRIKDGKSLPAGVVAYYPVTKVWTDVEALSWQKYGLGYALDAALMKAMNEAYLGSNMALNPLISPALANNEDLAAFPPTLLIGGTADILYDQWQEFYHNLQAVNDKAQAYTLPEAAHLFITVPGQPTARQLAIELTSQFMKE